MPALTPARKQPTAIIVGAGVGGVASAARLAHAGFAVTVLEQNDFVGGRCSLIHTESGHRFDQGPSLLLLPRLFHETYADLGTSMEAEGVELVRCEPNYQVHFGDGECFTMSSDLVVMKREIERFEGEQGFSGYLGFMKEAHAHYHLSQGHVLHSNFYSIFSMLRLGLLKDLMSLHAFESIYSRACRFFQTERLRRVFTFASMYMGMSPFDALATYSLLQYTELAEGIWYPLGGFQKIVSSIAAIAERKGATFRLSTKVSQILLDPSDPKRATGVVLASGEKLEADIVIVNADLIWSLNHLFPGEPTPYAKRLANKPVSCSSISFYWSLDTVIKELGSHSIFLASEYKESFDAIFKEHTIPEDPSFYVNVPSHHDPSAAPEGQSAVIVLVPVGHISEKLKAAEDWNKIVNETRKLIIDTMEKRLGITGLRGMIKAEQVNTPVTWADKFNLHRGSILGLSHSFFNVLSFRPKTRHPSIKGAYFVGASTHPGTGVPICLAGARITTEQVLGDFGLEAPWPAFGTVSATKAEQAEVGVLDRKHVATRWLGGEGLAAAVAVVLGLVLVRLVGRE